LNLQACRVVLRERTLGELLDLGCLLCSSAALGLHLRLAAAVLLPAYALCLVAHYWLEWHPAWVWVIAYLGCSLLQSVFTVGVGRWLFAERLSVRDVLGLWLRQLPSFFGAWLVSRALTIGVVLLFVAGSLDKDGAAAALIGFGILLGLPLVVVAVRMVFVYEASLLETARPIAAARRSGRLADAMGGRAWAAMFVLLLCGPVAVLLTEVLCRAIVGDLLQLGEPFKALWEVGFSPWALAGLFASVPYVATARFLMYVDGRTRSDAWDVQVRFMAIASRPQAPTGLGRGGREAAA
jgi:hypothetical protein